MSEQTHDFRDSLRGKGHDIHYKPGPNDTLDAGGWAHGLHPGDFILLTNGDSDTRYRIGDDLRYERDPKDMWWATLHFAPRP